MQEPFVHFKQFSSLAQKTYDVETNTLEVILTAKILDRDSEVILPLGVDFENFKKNPVLLDSHKYYECFESLIGKVLPDTFKQSEDVLSAIVQFDVNDEKAKQIAGKYERGFANAFSIGFIGKKYGEPILPGQLGKTIEECELIELSTVVIPANALAVSKSISLSEYEKQIKKQSKTQLETAFLKGLDKAHLEILEMKNEILINRLKKL